MPLDQEQFKFPDEKAEETKQDEIQFEVEGEGEPEVEVVNDTPPEDRDRPPMKEPPAEVTDDELAQYSEGVKKRIQHFSKGYHEERRAKEAAFREREEAIRLAQQLMEENKKLQSSQGQTQQVLLEQAKKVVASELEQAKRKYKEAYEAGDADALVAAQEEITAAKIRADRVNNFKPTPLQEEKPVVQTAPQPTPQYRPDPSAQAWQQQNQWFGEDEEMTSLALGLHEKLRREGVQVSSQEYYRKIDATIRKRFPEKFGEEAEQEERPVRKSSVVAPATRTTSPKRVRLNPSELSLAKKLNLTPEQYAKAKIEMEANNG